MQVCIYQDTSIEQANAAELLPSFDENYVASTAIATETGEGKDCKEPAIPALIFYLGPDSRYYYVRKSQDHSVIRTYANYERMRVFSF